MYKLLLAVTLFVTPLTARNRELSSPYISGENFKAFCDFAYDEHDRSLNPESVLEGDVVFVKTDYISEFFETIHPSISYRYIIVTHDSDYPFPGTCSNYLEDEKIIAWFGQNFEGVKHPKAIPIPIGVANSHWAHGNVSTLAEKQRLLPRKKTVMLYLNFNNTTFFQERSFVYELFKNEPYCQVSKPKAFDAYLNDLTHSKFVLCPRGNGIDCHRTWETFLMGSIPVLKTSSLDPLYEGLPVVIVQDWKEINLPFLRKKYLEMSLRSYDMERMYIAYWLNLIASKKVVQ